MKKQQEKPASAFHQPKDEDIVVLIHGQRWVSLESLQAAGIDVSAPFLVWADDVSSTIYARQKPSWRGENPGRLFEGPMAITGIPHHELGGLPELELIQLAEERSGGEDGWVEVAEGVKVLEKMHTPT